MKVTALKGLITLDAADHKYLVDGVKVENQISVSALINNQYQPAEQNAAMYAGTKVHKELEQIFKGHWSSDFSQQSTLLSRLFWDKVGKTNEPINTEVRFGVHIDMEDGREVNLFGTADCVVGNQIWEFKTSMKKDYPTYKWQVSLYRYMDREKNSQAWKDTYICSLAGITDYSHMNLEEIEEYLETKLEQYFSPVVNADSGGIDFTELYLNWKQLDEAAKAAKKQLEEQLEEKIPEHEGAFVVDFGGFIVKKTVCHRTSYDSDLIREKLPEALKIQEYYRTIYNID